jgi:hypothetical protein
MDLSTGRAVDDKRTWGVGMIRRIFMRLRYVCKAACVAYENRYTNAYATALISPHYFDPHIHSFKQYACGTTKAYLFVVGENI